MSSPNETPRSGPGDVALLRIMAASTAIAFATVLGAVACVDGGSSQGLVFRWRWLALLWMAFGALAGWFLWQAVWAADTVGTPRVRRRLMIYLVLLGIGGVAVFVFPITFVPPGQFRDVLTGLIAAVAVLTFVGWMIFHLGKLFSADGADDRAGKRADPKSPDRP